MEDACIVLAEALVPRNHPGHHALVEGQRGDGGQQPAVTCTDNLVRSLSMPSQTSRPPLMSRLSQNMYVTTTAVASEQNRILDLQPNKFSDS